MKVTTKREDFLSNSMNKAFLISKLKTELELDNQKVSVSTSDADTLIVEVALEVMLIIYNF